MTTARTETPEASQAAPAVGIRLDRPVGRPAPKRHPILDAIARLRLAESTPAEGRILVGSCGNCRRDVYIGGAFLHGRGVYCATEGCALAALGWNETPNVEANRPKTAQGKP